MVERGLGQVGTPGAQAARVELGESLRRGDLVDQVPVDVEDRGRRVALWGDDVGIPQLVEQGLGHRCGLRRWRRDARSEEHTSELQSLMRISYAVFCLTKKTHTKTTPSSVKPPTTRILIQV